MIERLINRLHDEGKINGEELLDVIKTQQEEIDDLKTKVAELQEVAGYGD